LREKIGGRGVTPTSENCFSAARDVELGKCYVVFNVIRSNEVGRNPFHRKKKGKSGEIYFYEPCDAQELQETLFTITVATFGGQLSLKGDRII